MKKYNFWKENKISGHFELTEKQLISKFREWLPSKKLEWYSYYRIEDCLNCFISEALNAIGNTDNDFREYREMEELLNPIRREYINVLENKIVNQ